MKKQILFLLNVIGCITLFSQQIFYYKSNGDSVVLQRNDYVKYFEFKQNLSKSIEDSLLNQLTYRIDTCETYGKSGKINIKNDSLLLIFESYSNNFSYCSSELMDEDSTIYWAQNSILAKIKPNINLVTQLNNLNISFTKIEEFSKLKGVYCIQLIDNVDAIEISKALFLTGNFEYVEPNLSAFTQDFGTEDYNDNPYFYTQWALQESHPYNINAVSAWNTTTGNPNIKIGVIDSGVDYEHIDLLGNAIPGYDAVDDIVPNPSEVYVLGNGGPGLHQSDYHGTCCAGIIGCVDNDLHIIGIAHTSKIYPIRTGYYKKYLKGFHLGDEPFVYIPHYYINFEMIIKSFNNALENNIDITSNSWGGIGYSSAVNDAIHTFATEGRNGLGGIVVFASGNDLPWNQMTGLSSLDHVIGVGGINYCGYVSDKNNPPCVIDGTLVYDSYSSCYGNYLDLVAPGRLISTIIPYDYETTIGYFGGTSSATPMVAAAVALILSVNPCLTNEEVQQILTTTATKIHPEEYTYTTDLTVHPYGSWNMKTGYGELNVNDAVVMAKTFHGDKGEYISGDVHLNGNIVWNQNQYTTRDLYVENGATLNISSTISFSSGTALYVKPGGKLIINGGELTNYCSDFPWRGIIIEGNSNSNQMGNAINQSQLTLNNATISNAICGIQVGYMNDLTKSGGIIRATNVTFTNNGTSVLFAPYRNMLNNDEIANKSVFNHCTFTTNNDFLNSEMIFKSNVELNGVKGIRFIGCNFLSTYTAEYDCHEPSYSRVGILSFNSGFSVKPQCNTSVLGFGDVCSCNNIVYSSNFSGLDYAIVAEGCENPLFVDIQSSNFENNETGIIIKGLNNPRILNNTFLIGKYSNSRNSVSFGVKLENTFDFRLEDNSFAKSTISGEYYLIGVYVNNSGKHNNVVYNNTFNELNVAQIFDGMNYSPVFPDRGLLSLCNYHANNIRFDIFVTPPTFVSQTGINQYQCNSSNISNTNSILSAGNTFSDEGNIEIQYCNSSTPTINYIFDPNNTQSNPSTTCNLLSFEGLAYECESRVFNIDINDMQSELISVRLSLNNLKYNYNLLIDAGNTEELLDIVQGDWSEDVWGLREDLINNSPFLSEEILRNVAEENQLPQALFLEVCLANPDATKDEKFLDFLRYDIPNPLPEYMIELIFASWETQTLRTEMEEQLSIVNTRNDFLSNNLTSYLLVDTIYNYNTIKTQIQTRGSSNDYFTLAEIAILQNDFVSALDYMYFTENYIPNLTKEEIDEIVSFIEYINFRESVYQSGNTIYNLDSNQLLTLKNYATENNFRGCALAKSILCMLYNDCIDEPFAEPKTLQTTNGRNSFSKAKNISIADVTVMPNPATTFATFEWDLKSYPDQAILYIYDQMGKMITSKLIETNQGQWVWDTRNYPNGPYIYILKSEKHILNSGKIIVNK